MRFLMIVCCVLWLATTAPAQETPPAEPAKKEYPGLSEFVPMATELANEASLLPERIKSFQQTTELEKEFGQIRQRSERLKERIASLGEKQEWSFERLLDYKQRLDAQARDLQKLIAAISERLSSIESIQQKWREKEIFWNEWIGRLQDSPPPVQIRKEVFDTIQKTHEQLSGATKPLLRLQDDIAGLQREKNQEMGRVDTLLQGLRSDFFEKNDHSLSSPRFYEQLKLAFTTDLPRGVRDAFRWEENFLHNHRLLILAQLGLAVGLGLIIRLTRRKSPEELEWQFVLDRPFSTGVFISVLSLSGFYANAPPLWYPLLWVLGAVAGLRLIGPLLRKTRRIWLIHGLTLVFLVTQTVHAVSLPSPIYRLFQVLLVMALIPVLILALRSGRRTRRPLYPLSLHIGLLLLVLSLGAQWLGYSALATLMFEASISTVLLYLFVYMGIRLGRGIIEFVLSHPRLTHYSIFREFGQELSNRLKGLFNVLILGYAVLYLFKIWSLFESPRAAWGFLTDWSFKIGELSFNIQTLMLAALTIYGAFMLSWFLDALLETEVFPRKKIQRGVRDSIKRLMHYCILLIGLIMAATMAGFDMRAFAVVAGALGIGIGFGLQNVVNNFVSGLILLFERPVKLGDMVVMEETWGTVRKIGLRSTVMETLDQSEIIVPNSKLISETVTNWSLTSRQCRVVLPVGVSYGSDVEKVMRILLEVAQSHPEVLKEPAPSPIFVGFGDSSLDFQFRAWIRDVKRRLITVSEIGMEIIKRFREEGVEIPFPQRDLHLRSLPPQWEKQPPAAKPPSVGED